MALLRVGENIPFNFQSMPYTYSGIVDTAKAFLDLSLSEQIQNTVAIELQTKPPGTRVTPGRNIVRYEIGLRITFAWVMQGGAFTYGECQDAIMRLVSFLEAHDNFEWHPARTSITVGNLEKIRVVAEMFQSEEVNIGGAEGLHLQLNGWFWPTRRLSMTGVHNVIGRLINDDLTHNPQDVVMPWSRRQVYLSMDVRVEVDFEPRGLSMFPQYTYEDLRILMQNVDSFFQQRGSCGPFRGAFITGIDTWGGFFTLESRFDVASNGTVAKLGASRRTGNTTQSGLWDVSINRRDPAYLPVSQKSLSILRRFRRDIAVV